MDPLGVSPWVRLLAEVQAVRGEGFGTGSIPSRTAAQLRRLADYIRSRMLADDGEWEERDVTFVLIVVENCRLDAERRERAERKASLRLIYGGGSS